MCYLSNLFVEWYTKKWHIWKAFMRSCVFHESFKKELSTREKTFSPVADNTKYIVSSLFIMINSKRILTFSYLLCTKNYKTQTCMVVRPLGTRKNINKDKSHWFICLIGGHISKNCANKCFKRQLLLKPGSGPWKGSTLKSMDPEKHKIKKHAWL